MTSRTKADFVIVTALEEERDAVLDRLPGHQRIPPTTDDPRVYFFAELPATFSDGSTCEYRLVLTSLLIMGQTDAATASADAIRRWNPRYVILVGIAGGIAEHGVDLGDLLIADQVVDYELQKLTARGPEVRYNVYRTDARLLAFAKNYTDYAWLESVSAKRPKKGTPRRHIGPIATGNKVIALSDVMKRYANEWPKLIGVEMEAGGVATACFQAEDSPGFFMVRAVSDLADEDKDSPSVRRWRRYACDVAASFLIGLLKSGPVPVDKAQRGDLGKYGRAKRSVRDAVQEEVLKNGGRLDILNRSLADFDDDVYQELPLLQEIGLRDLPRERKGVQISSGSPAGLRTLGIHGWEEVLQRSRAVHSPTELETVFRQFRHVTRRPHTDVPRFVILGPPGSGKTTMCRWLAWRAARNDLFNWRLLPALVSLAAWEDWSKHHQQFTLPDFLATLYPTAHAKFWSQSLEDGNVLVLLDGLDEIQQEPSFVKALTTTLSRYSRCPTVVACRTVSRERHETICSDLPVFVLSAFNKQQRNRYIRCFPAETKFDRDALIRQLDGAPLMDPLAANPLLLSIICFVAQEGMPLPATRGDLYEHAILGLLRQPLRVRVHYPGAEPDHDEKLAVLEKLALELFLKDDRTLTYLGRPLGRALRMAIAAEGYSEAPAAWANALRDDLVHNSGVLRRDVNGRYFFLHLTVQEFLAASALGRAINESSRHWDTTIDINGRRVSIRRLVDTKAWDPAWQEVITLLAHRLNDPAPLLEMFSSPVPTDTNPRGDDLFRHRNSLAALCLAEISKEKMDSISALTDQITTDTFDLWWRHETNGTVIRIWR